MTAISWFRRRRRTSAMGAVLTTVIAVLVLSPIALLLLGSLRSAPPGVPGTFTLDNYLRLLDPRVLTAAANSLTIAVGATVCSVFFGGTIAWLVARTNVPLARLWRTTTVIPFYLSPLFGALAWNLLANPRIGAFAKIGIPVNINTVGGILWVIGLYYAPFVYLLTVDAMARIDVSIEEAGRMSGASEARVQLQIVLPLLKPALLGSALIVFVLALEQFGVPSLLGSPHGIRVLSTTVYERIATYPADYPGAAAVGGTLMVAGFVGLLLRNRALRGRSYRVVGGKSIGRTSLVNLGRWRLPAALFCWCYFALAGLLPLLALAVSSGVQAWGTWDVTSAHWARVVGDGGLEIIRNSLVVSVAAGVVGTILGFLSGYVIERSSGRRHPLALISILPLGLPGVVIGVGFLWAYVHLPSFVYGSLIGLGLAYVTRFLPIVTQAGEGTFAQVSTDLEEASWSVGASKARTLRDIVLPLIQPGLLSGVLLVFISSFRELGTTILLYGPRSVVMSVDVWLSYVEGYYGRAAATALLQSAILLVAVAILTKVGARRRSRVGGASAMAGASEF